MKKAIFIIFLLFTKLSFSQENEVLTLEKCYEQAQANYPQLKQKDFNKQATDLRLQNLRAAWLPTIDLNAQATYQSDVTKIDANLPFPNVSFPNPSKDQYKATIDVSQVIYEGGVISAQKKLEQTSVEVDIQNVETKLYQIKDRVNQTYFTLLILQERESLINSILADLHERLKSMETAIANGAAMQVNADMLNAEILKTEQQLIETQTSRETALAILSDLTGKQLNSSTKVEVPQIAESSGLAVYRPELKLLELQQTKLEATSLLLAAQRRPRLIAFGQVGYGKPGLNMMNDKFDSFYLVGAKLSWNIWDWDKTKRQRSVNEIQKNILTNEIETLDKNIRQQAIQEQGTIKQLQLLIENDQKIIELRSKITKNFAAQLDNGTITTSEYITQFNAESQAKLNLEIHKAQLIKAKVNLKTILNQ